MVSAQRRMHWIIGCRRPYTAPSPCSLARRTTFDSIHSFLVSEREFLHLERDAEIILAHVPLVDSLHGYTEEMWDMLTTENGERFGFSIPHPWTSATIQPRLSLPGERMLLCLDQHTAQRLHNDVQDRYLRQKFNPSRLSAFGTFGLNVPNDVEREREGMEFLARQVNHFTAENQRIIVLLSRSSELWPMSDDAI